MQTVRLVKVGRSLMVTIPRPLLARLHLLRGDTVTVEEEGNGVLFRPVKPHPVGLASPALASRAVARPAEEDEK